MCQMSAFAMRVQMANKYTLVQSRIAIVGPTKDEGHKHTRVHLFIYCTECRNDK